MKHTWPRKGLILCFWLVVWQAAGMIIHNTIIFVGPVEMARSLASILIEPGFWRTIAYSFGRISLGFFLGFFLGILMGAAAYRCFLLKELLEPAVLLMKSVPVASFVILALIWMGSRNLSVIISFLVVFPIIYVNTIAGLHSTDPKLLEMAKVFSMPSLKKLSYIYRPALLPYLISGCNTALGMSLKSGIAAEVIGVPDHSIGERLYMAKIYLDTADLFAWTFVIILISAAFEKLFLFLLSRAAGGAPAGGPAGEGKGKKS